MTLYIKKLKVKISCNNYVCTLIVRGFINKYVAQWIKKDFFYKKIVFNVIPFLVNACNSLNFNRLSSEHFKSTYHVVNIDYCSNLAPTDYRSFLQWLSGIMSHRRACFILGFFFLFFFSTSRKKPLISVEYKGCNKLQRGGWEKTIRWMAKCLSNSNRVLRYEYFSLPLKTCAE